jgi:hypothetical protein
MTKISFRRETPFRDGVARWTKLQNIQRLRVTDAIAVARIATGDLEFATARPLLELFGAKPGSEKGYGFLLWSATRPA